MALFRAKFVYIFAIRNPVFRWESCKGSVWESVKNCSNVCKEAGTRGWISQVAHGYKLPDWSTRAKHAKSWSVALAIHYRTKVPGWPSHLLTAWTCDSTQLRGWVASSSRQNTLFGKIWIFTFLLTLLYIYPYTHDLERELLERILREKP